MIRKLGYYNIVIVINVSSTALCCFIALSKYDKVIFLENSFDELPYLKYENVPNYPVMNLILFYINKHTQLISVSVNCIPVYGNLFIIKPYNYALLGRCNVNNTSLYVGLITYLFEGIHFKETNIAKRSVHCRFFGPNI